MMEILSLQEAEKASIRDAAAKRSLEEIQQEQEFQQWWEAESKRAIEEEEQAKRATERAARAAKGRGKGRGGAAANALETKPAKSREGKKDRRSGEENRKDTKKTSAVNDQHKDKTAKPRTPKPKVQPQAPPTEPSGLQAPNPEAPIFVPPTGPKADNAPSNSRGRGRGGHQRGGRGGGDGHARGGRFSAPPRDVQSAAAAPAQHA